MRVTGGGNNDSSELTLAESQSKGVNADGRKIDVKYAVQGVKVIMISQCEQYRGSNSTAV